MCNLCRLRQCELPNTIDTINNNPPPYTPLSVHDLEMLAGWISVDTITEINLTKSFSDMGSSVLKGRASNFTLGYMCEEIQFLYILASSSYTVYF